MSSLRLYPRRSLDGAGTATACRRHRDNPRSKSGTPPAPVEDRLDPDLPPAHRPAPVHRQAARLAEHLEPVALLPRQLLEPHSLNARRPAVPHLELAVHLLSPAEQLRPAPDRHDRRVRVLPLVHLGQRDLHGPARRDRPVPASSP